MHGTSYFLTGCVLYSDIQTSFVLFSLSCFGCLHLTCSISNWLQDKQQLQPSQYNQLQQDRSNAVSQFEAKRQNLVSQQQQLVAQQVAKGKEQLSKEIENWSPETIRGIVDTGKEYGFTEAELNSIVDTRQVRALHDAMQWRKLKSKNSVTKKKVASAKPVVKPGSKDPKKAANSNSRKMREQLRKTGSSDLASKLIENMI